MVEKRFATPEKQLLELIENADTQQLSRGIKKNGLSWFSLGAWKGRFSFLIDKISFRWVFKRTFLSITGVNKILLVCVVVLFLYLGLSFTVSTKKIKDTPDFAIPSSSSKVSGEEEILLKNISYYAAGTKSKDIFKFGKITEKEPAPVQQTEDASQPQKPVVPQLAELVKDLKLVGIGWSPQNPDVMVENSRTKKMYFLKTGDSIEEGIKVKEIFRDKVTLRFEDQEIELR